MHTIPFHSSVNGKQQAAFVIFFARDGKPWEKYPTSDNTRKNLVIPTCLMINRADGDIGFIGGKVEEGESLEVAAKREVEEEIGHVIQLELKPIVAHDIGSITTHAFVAEMAYEELRAMQKAATAGAHFGSEVTGIFLPHLIDYDAELGKGGGLVNLMKNSLAPSVREELVHFLLKKEIFTDDTLAVICQESDYNLTDLLK